MTAITQNLPRFVNDLGISIVGKKCYTSLVENLDISDIECIKYSFSKGLGLGIVVGGSIVKVPQISLIANARSARGLSFPAYILETLSYAITLAYSFRHGFPFSTYGENFFLALQNVSITLLIIYYPPSRSVVKGSPDTRNQKLVGATLLAFAVASVLYIIPTHFLSVLQVTTIPLSLFSKLPQIRQNARAKSTGQLSAFAVVSQIVGCIARLFTTATEVGDRLVSAGFALALVLNIILGIQLWKYWGDVDVKNEVELQDQSAYSEKRAISPSPQAASSEFQALHQPQAVRATAVSTSTMSHRVSTPPPRTPSGAGSRKWARKVD